MKSKKEKPRDVSPYTEKKKTKLNLDISIRELPWTDKQKKFIQLANDKHTKVIITKGVAGTSKTLLAVYCALQKIKDKKISEIYYSRVPVEASVHGIGYIKGTSEEKMSPYTHPMVDKLNELLTEPHVKALMADERIVGIPLGFLRGLNISNAAFIMDEAQNCRIEDFLLVMTRMAKFSTLFICGDAQQSDIKQSGFDKIFNLFSTECAKERGIHTFEFGKEDIVRSEILSYIIERFENIKK
jgi:phosphate starvation-inducible protein PhoH